MVSSNSRTLLSRLVIEGLNLQEKITKRIILAAPLRPGACIIKLITAVIYGFLNKL